MDTTTIQPNLISGLLEQGYAHVKYPYSSNLQELLSDLGTVLYQTEIRENPRSTRLLASNQHMDYHTDHYAARYIAWLCHSQSAIGGESMLIDTFSILAALSNDVNSLLTEIMVNTHQVFYDDSISLPLLKLDKFKQPISVYYAPWLVNKPLCTRHQKALEKFTDAIKTAQPFIIKLSEGDVLIIDNHRMLHGRGGFPQGSDRWLTRYWLQASTI